ncbi:hypothetical protein CMV_026427 [Castanea mollissima]|uniref:Uncharacterized protein n=1 Tax=Castanea mollissima TaxID=60419 RepID=A0A8J4QB59_9ROSI|nr:hypothetical protein CMV_026427 [Castanea mollissima]
MTDRRRGSELIRQLGTASRSVTSNFDSDDVDDESVRRRYFYWIHTNFLAYNLSSIPNSFTDTHSLTPIPIPKSDLRRRLNCTFSDASAPTTFGDAPALATFASQRFRIVSRRFASRRVDSHCFASVRIASRHAVRIATVRVTTIRNDPATRRDAQQLIGDPLASVSIADCDFQVGDNCRSFMETFQEVAESQGKKEDNKDASDTAGLLEKLNVGDDKTEGKEQEQKPDVVKEEDKQTYKEEGG